MNIASLRARRIWDSRGRPTIEVEVKDPKAEAIDPIDESKIIAIKNPINPIGRLSMM